MSLPPLIAAMSRPEIYPHRPASVTLIQTHISYVFLAGDQVYKVKKPVRFTFLDFSTPALRQHFCHEEVRLNRRLAADVYVGVVAICGDGARYRLSAADAPDAIEYAVHMRRLPADRTLDQLVDQHQVTPDMIDAIATRLAAFHRTADAGPHVAANGDPAAVWRILTDNYSNAQRFRGITIAPADDDAIQRFARAFLDRHDALFRQRQAGDHIKDGHGDLHTDHIYCTDPLVIVDCVEFNPMFRYCDVASDLAFAVMDLDYHHRPDLAQRLVDRYVAESADNALPELLPFYQCYRAYVRGKVDSLKSVEDEVAPAEQAAAKQSATRHFALAYRYTWARTPCLVIIAGLSGTGKSAIAGALQQRAGFTHINSDVVRKQLAGLRPDAPRAGGYDEGIYATAHSERTYGAMFKQAAEELSAGRGVVIDATFQRRSGRDTARLIAARHHVPILVVECRCSDEEVRRRLRQRHEQGYSVSDADWNIYLEQRRHYEDLGPDEQPQCLVLDTSGSVADSVAAIEHRLREIA